MRTIHDGVLWFHIACGCVGLVVFWVPALTRKGGPTHRKAGWVYVSAMLGVVVSAVVLAALLFVDPEAAHDFGGGQPEEVAAGVARARAVAVLFGALALLTVTTATVTIFDFQAQAGSSLEERKMPMKFNWVACQPNCRGWVTAVGIVTADSPGDFEAFARGRDLDGATVVLTTHDMDEVEKICDRVGIMCKGKLVALDSPLALRTAHTEKKADVVLHDGERLTFNMENPADRDIFAEVIRDSRVATVRTREFDFHATFLKLTGQSFE